MSTIWHMKVVWWEKQCWEILHSDSLSVFSSTRFSRLAPDVSHASLPGAAHHGLLPHEHVQQGVRQHGAQHGHDHAGRHLNSGRPLQDWGGGELLQSQTNWDQGGSGLSKSWIFLSTQTDKTDIISKVSDWNTKGRFTARSNRCHEKKWLMSSFWSSWVAKGSETALQIRNPDFVLHHNKYLLSSSGHE